MSSVQVDLKQKLVVATASGAQAKKLCEHANQAGYVAGILNSKVMTLTEYLDTRHMLHLSETPAEDMVKEYCTVMHINAPSLVGGAAALDDGNS